MKKSSDIDAPATAAALNRGAAMDAFLARVGWAGATRAPLAGDASNRAYQRVRRGDGAEAVLMDAPPHTHEDVRPFAAVTGYLRGRGFSAPDVYAADCEAGFLLLEDLGDDLFARAAAREPALEAPLYAAAVDLLAALQREAAPAATTGWGAERVIRPYDAATLSAEARLAVEWWAPGAGEGRRDPDLIAAYDAAVSAACAPVADIASVLTLRDYHAENLMWLPARDGDARVGLLDYQDARAGHPAYDLVSLLEDARRDVAPELAAAMLSRFLAASATADPAAFRRDYAILGAQRNLKIVGIFARLWLRDGKDKYLAHIPRVWGYLRRDLAHPALADLAAFVEARLPEPTPERLARLRARTPGALGPTAGAAV